MVDPRGLNHPIASETMIDGVEVGVYRASAVGMCEHALLAARMGIEGAAPPEQMQKVFSEGHDNETRVLDLFYEQAKYLTSYTRGGGSAQAFEPLTVSLTIGSTIRVIGHVDDLAVHAPTPAPMIVVEAKAVGKDLWKQWADATFRVPEVETRPVDGEHVFARLDGPWQKYRDQAEIYMRAAGATECAFVVGEKPARVEGEKTRGLVESIKYVWLKPDAARFAKIMAKIAGVEARARSGATLPVECDQQQYPCPYYYLMHPQKNATRKVDDDALGSLLREHYDAGVLEKGGKNAKAAAKKKLDEWFEKRGKEDTSLNGENGESGSDGLIECGGFTVKKVSRPQPAQNRKAYVQEFYDVKPVK